MHQKHIFKCSLEVQWILALKFGMKEKIMAINSCVTVKLITKHLRPFIMTSLFLPDMLHTDKDLHFLRFVAYHSKIWYLGTCFIAYWSHCIKKGKTCHGLSNNDVIDLKAMMKNTHSILFYRYYGLPLWKLVFGGLSCCWWLIITNSFQKSKMRLQIV